MAKKFEIFDFWEIDTEQQEPVGSKEKYWIYKEGEGLLWVAVTQDEPPLYLIKLVRPGDHIRESIGEDWAEVIAARICKLLRIPHADYDFASWNKQRAVISPRFIGRNESLMHMDEVMQLPDEPSIAQRRKRSRIYYTLPNLWNIFSQKELLLPPKQAVPDGIDTPLDLFIGYLMLDALIGNTDRHEQNICLILRYSKAGTKQFLAPTFDHASSLGRELPESKLIELLSNEQKFQQYRKRCMSKIYSGGRPSEQLSTMTAFHEAGKRSPSAAKIWLDSLIKLSEDDVRKLLLRIPEQLITEAGIKFALQLICENKEELLGLRGKLK